MTNRLARRLTAVIAAVSLAAAASLSARQSPAEGTFVIRAGQLLDPDAGTLTPNQVIVVERGKITSVGSDARTPPGAVAIDLSSFTVMPGMADAHTHLCMVTQERRDANNYYFTTLLDSTPFRAIQGAANARALLEAGFTMARDIGNAGNYADSDLRRAIAAGIVPGPTLINAGRIIAPYGGQFQLQPEKRALGEPEYAFADTHDEMTKAVRENAHFGATVIKIVVDDQRYIYSIDDITFIMAEAARAGLKVAAHAWTAAGAHNAAAAGVASIEHGPAITDEDLAVARANHVVLVGTDFLSIGAPNHEQWIDRLRRAYRAGVTMAYGTDVINGVGPERARLTLTGLDPWVEAQVPAKTLLQALTSNAARLLGLDAARGFIRAGLAADLVAVPGNPLQDVTVLKRAAFVMKDGRVVKRP